MVRLIRICYDPVHRPFQVGGPRKVEYYEQTTVAAVIQALTNNPESIHLYELMTCACACNGYGYGTESLLDSRMRIEELDWHWKQNHTVFLREKDNNQINQREFQ